MLTIALGTNCTVEAAPHPSKGDPAQVSPAQVVCLDERITVNATSVTRDALLDNIAKACRVRILSPSAEITKTMVSVELIEADIADALGELMRGCNYLVVYNESIDNAGFAASTIQGRAPEPQSISAAETEPVVVAANPLSDVDQRQAQIDYLREQIEIINDRIASGASDRFFQNALKHKRPEFIHDDRKVLARYQRELAILAQR